MTVFFKKNSHQFAPKKHKKQKTQSIKKNYTHTKNKPNKERKNYENKYNRILS